VSAVTDIAARNNVSRKFVYGQKKIADQALNQAFEPVAKNDEVLFYLPVTKQWIRQFVLALLLICHSSFRGVHLLELRERGLHPDFTIADGGKGLRAGQAAAWPDIACHGDVFHPERDLGKLVRFLENRAAGAKTQREKLESKMVRAKNRGKGQKFSKALAIARQTEKKASQLAQEVRILSDWMRDDVLCLAGPDLATRRELFDFIVEQLENREPLSKKIRPVRRMLQNQRDTLLAFVSTLEKRFAELADQLGIPVYLVHAVCELHKENQNHPSYWERRDNLYKKLKNNFYRISQSVEKILKDTPRASSLVENLNSRLRNYFFLRRHIGNDYLGLLRFFLNHRCFMRSEHPEREGLSPLEIMTGTKHPHWLESLGFERFCRN
jgi:hypothetical protein